MIGAGITPQRTSVKANDAELAGDRDVAGGHQADTAAIAGAVDQSHGRPREGVEATHRLGGPQREGQIVLGRGGAQPPQAVEVGSGLEMPAVAAQHQRADPRLALELAQSRAERIDHSLVVGIVHLGTVQRDRRDVPLIDRRKHDVLGHGRQAPQGNGLLMQGAAPVIVAKSCSGCIRQSRAADPLTRSKPRLARFMRSERNGHTCASAGFPIRQGSRSAAGRPMMMMMCILSRLAHWPR